MRSFVQEIFLSLYAAPLNCNGQRQSERKLRLLNLVNKNTLFVCDCLMSNFFTYLMVLYKLQDIKRYGTKIMSCE